MSAGVLAAATVPTSRPFIIRCGGFDITGHVPLGDFPVHVSETTDGPGQMTFTIEDTLAREFSLGSEVTLDDRRNGGNWALFGGHLINMRSRPRPSGTGKLIECTAIGYDAWLDWRVVPAWSSVNARTGSSLSFDRAMVQQVINRFGGARIGAPDQTVTSTNANMDRVSVRGVTVRER